MAFAVPAAVDDVVLVVVKGNKFLPAVEELMVDSDDTWATVARSLVPAGMELFGCVLTVVGVSAVVWFLWLLLSGDRDTGIKAAEDYPNRPQLSKNRTRNAK